MLETLLRGGRSGIEDWCENPSACSSSPEPPNLPPGTTVRRRQASEPSPFVLSKPKVREMGEEDDSIEQAVATRRERLRALRAAQELLNAPSEDSAAQADDKSDGENENDEDDAQEENPSMKFRNYVPHDKQLQEGKVAPPVLPKFEDPVATEPPPAEKKDPFINIAPKKPNWDLRRDVQKKLDKLERRTQKAMYKIVQEQEKQKEKAEEDGENGASE